MPIYEYRCEECGHLSEALRAMAAADEPLACEACGSARTGRVHSVFSAAVASRGECAAGPMPMGGCGNCCGQPDACPYT
jgi:putative FmdB family regulatory protein